MTSIAECRDRVEDFECPLYTEVLPRLLWVGGSPEGYYPHDMDMVVSLYPWGQNRPASKLQELEVHTMYDSGTVPDVRLLTYLADTVYRGTQVGSVLVHCQKGINRSPLVVAFALIRHWGLPPIDAVAKLRLLRSPYVLMNHAFHSWLMTESYKYRLDS